MVARKETGTSFPYCESREAREQRTSQVETQHEALVTTALALGADGRQSSENLQLSHGTAAEFDWLQAAIHGDAGGFCCLVRKYEDRLRNALLHMCGCIHEAEDVVQDAFVQAHVKLKSFAGGSNFYTWLYRIAMNIAITRHRRRRKAVSLDQSRERGGLEPQDKTEPAEAGLLRQERVEQVRIALARLNDDYRVIIVLREMEGHDYQTISQILSLPVGTVRSRLHRARLQLRDQLVLVSESGVRAEVRDPHSRTNSAGPLMMADSPPPGERWWSSN